MRKPHLPDWDWRIWGGSLITVVWLGGGVVYLTVFVGWAFWREGAETIGGFFEGFFAPLAFLWLVVGLFIQQKELSRNREELRHSNVLSAQQASAIEASALTARQQAFFLIAENVRRQTGNLLGAMLAAEANDIVSSEEDMPRYWSAHAAGDYEVFARLFVTRGDALDAASFGDIRAAGDFFFGSHFRAQMSGEYIRSFRRLLKLARDCDSGNVILGTVIHTPHGMVYSAMVRRLEAPLAWEALDAPEPEGPDVDFTGTWDAVFETSDPTLARAAVFTIVLEAEAGRLTGVGASPRGETPLHDCAASGNAIYFRVHEPSVLLLWATFEDGVMRGRAEGEYGSIYPFTARKRRD